MRVNWCKTCDNFGDKLTQPLLLKLSNVYAIWEKPALAQAIGVGSILVRNNGRERVPTGYKGIILGSGMMYDVRGPDLRRARIVAIRGPLSARACHLDPDAVQLGDLGLLAPVLDEREGTNVGRDLVVPHNSDKAMRDRHPDRTFVSLREEPRDVVRQFRGACSVVSSSLHGIILADAMGMMRKWEPSDEVYGDGHKFRDHDAALGLEHKPGTYQRADAMRVRELQEQLFAAMKTVMP